LQPEVTGKDAHTVPIARIIQGMILDQEVRTSKGLLVAAKGQEVTAPLKLKLKSFLGKGAIADAVIVRRAEVGSVTRSGELTSPHDRGDFASPRL
jgi:hypothetical protein